MNSYPKEGMRVRVVSLDIKGTIDYVDKGTLLVPFQYGVQVKLDKPYDESGQLIYRTNPADLRRLKKKVKK